jgi:hypothetical protein
MHVGIKDRTSEDHAMGYPDTSIWSGLMSPPDCTKEDAASHGTRSAIPL